MNKFLLLLGLLAISFHTFGVGTNVRAFHTIAGTGSGVLQGIPISGNSSCVGSNNPGGCCTGAGAGTCEALVDGDISLVFQDDGDLHRFVYDASATDATASPWFVRPDDYSSAGVWTQTKEIEVLQLSFDPGAWYNSDTEVWLLDLHADKYPSGIVLTEWHVDCNVADPDVEMNFDLQYADAVGGGAFPGANATYVDAMDTTTGNSSETNNSNMVGNGVISTGKTAYILFNADPEGTCTQVHIRLHYYIERA